MGKRRRSGSKGNVSKRKRMIRKQKRRRRLERDAEVTEKYGREAHQGCGRKVRYPDEITALSKANKSMLYGAPPLRVYKCRYCGGWHLTSK